MRFLSVSFLFFLACFALEICHLSFKIRQLKWKSFQTCSWGNRRALNKFKLEQYLRIMYIFFETVTSNIKPSLWTWERRGPEDWRDFFRFPHLPVGRAKVTAQVSWLSCQDSLGDTHRLIFLLHLWGNLSYCKLIQNHRLISTSKTPCSFLLLLILSLQQN
jgi:hypothetical protein